MKEQPLRVNIRNLSNNNESIQIEHVNVPSFSNFSLGDTIEGHFISPQLQGRVFEIRGAQNNTGAPHVFFLDSVKYALLSSNQTANRRNIRGQRIRRLLLPRRLITRLTCLNLIEI